MNAASVSVYRVAVACFQLMPDSRSVQHSAPDFGRGYIAALFKASDLVSSLRLRADGMADLRFA